MLGLASFTVEKRKEEVVFPSISKASDCYTELRKESDEPVVRASNRLSRRNCEEKRLGFYADYVRIRSVCAAWRSALPKTHTHQCFQVPHLLLPYLDETATGRVFLSPFENKMCHLELLELPGKVLRGSSHGWVVALGKGLEMCLVSPLTRAQIQLPPLDTFPDVLAYRPRMPDEEYLVDRPFWNNRTRVETKPKDLIYFRVGIYPIVSTI